METVNNCIEVTTIINANGYIDAELIDHLGANAEEHFREMLAKGKLTPNDPENSEKYDETTLELRAINVHARSPSTECYQVIAMSTAHLTAEDRTSLSLAAREGDGMVFERDTGYFIKLYEPGEPGNYRHGHSDAIKAIIRWALYEGYRMIEIDCDAEELPHFPTFDG